MLSVRLVRRLRRADPDGYLVAAPLSSRPPVADPDHDLIGVTQGHYRIGSRHEPFAYDNELPPPGGGAVELPDRSPAGDQRPLPGLHGGRRLCGPKPVGSGRTRLARRQPGTVPPALAAGHARPLVWGGRRRPRRPPADQPVFGVNRHEAQAYANWVAGLDSAGAGAGAVLQHEYQWEVAARAGLIEEIGRVWEWCANPLHPYPDYTPFPDPASAGPFGPGQASLRGASLYTQRCLRRVSLRHWADPSSVLALRGSGWSSRRTKLRNRSDPPARRPPPQRGALRPPTRGPSRY